MSTSTNPEVLLTRRAVERCTGLSCSNIYKKMRAGSFPASVKVGTRNVRWRESEIRAWIDSRPQSNGETATE